MRLREDHFQSPLSVLRMRRRELNPLFPGYEPVGLPFALSAVVVSPGLEPDPSAMH